MNGEKNLHVEPMQKILELRGFSDFSTLPKRHENLLIYLAHREGNQYVIKVLSKTSKNGNEQNRLKNEARFSFDVTGLPTIIDFIDKDEYNILIRSHVSGVTLPVFWKTVPKKQRIRTLKLLIGQLVHLFSELTRSQVLHLDIKPSNILISQGEKDLEVHLIDFGLARFEGEIVKSHTYFPLGYAAPELVLNELDLLDHRTDLFALGVCIWELFEGNIPLSHPNPLVMTNLQLNLPLPEGYYLPNSLLALLHKLTKKYRFPKPPNQMDSSYVRQKIKEAMNLRYNDLTEFQGDLNALSEKRNWLVKLFSKS